MLQLDPGAPVTRVDEVGGRGGGVADQDFCSETLKKTR
jgi:hypothetical protein